MGPILIKFGDNDYINTFVPLLRAVKESGFEGSKDDLIELLNVSALSFYCIYQSRKMPGLSERDSIENWLRVDSDRVYYGREEVDAFFKDPAKMAQCDSDCFFFYPEMEDVGIL